MKKSKKKILCSFIFNISGPSHRFLSSNRVHHFQLLLLVSVPFHVSQQIVEFNFLLTQIEYFDEMADPVDEINNWHENNDDDRKFSHRSGTSENIEIK